MNAVLGVFKEDHAVRVKKALSHSGLASGGITMLAGEEISGLENLLKSSSSGARTKTGLQVGLVVGALFGLVLGLLMFPRMTGMDISPFAFGLLGMIPFAVLGGYLGSLYGSRSANRIKIRIKEQLAKKDTVLVIAHVERDEANAVLQSMAAADGEYVSARQLTEREAARLFNE